MKKTVALIFVFILCLIPFSLILAASADEEYESIDNSSCTTCHEEGMHGTNIIDDLSHSIHEGLDCQDCHQDKLFFPHKELLEFDKKSHGCRDCHETESEEYQIHGRAGIGEFEDMPHCSDCHGDHDVLPSSVKLSKTHSSNLPTTCGYCHEDLNISSKYGILIVHPSQIYENSVHGKATQSGIDDAATCNDCHSKAGTAHIIHDSGHQDSSINHFNIPETCGKCHDQETKDFLEGIHGQLVLRGKSDSPVCTNCHGEHGIIPPGDSLSPVSKSRLTEATCAPCHESITLTEKYGPPRKGKGKFIDTYHGLKSKAGDIHVANCASCHEYHLILPSSNPMSSIHPDNLQATCGECHPGISTIQAATSIHGIGENEQQNRLADIIKYIYIILIILVIGFMFLYVVIDYIRHIILTMKKSQIRRMDRDELWQHILLMMSFIVLVISGFALRFGDLWLTRFLFGWDHGFEVRGIIHRIAAVVLILTTAWHTFYLFSNKGRRFFKDMFPNLNDLKDLIQKILFNLGFIKTQPQFKRFSYVEKAEYWALIWGNAVMIITGLFLWFDNYLIRIFPKGVFEVSLVIHFYEAILATLAIIVWHLYFTIFNPGVYPMNPSWLTGKMPKEMYAHEHPAEIVDETKID